MIVEFAEVVSIGDWKPTSDGKSKYLPVTLQGLLTGNRYIIRHRKDHPVKLTFLVGQVWKELSLLKDRLITHKLKDPEEAIDSDYLSVDLIVAQPRDRYQFIGSVDGTYTFKQTIKENKEIKSIHIIVLSKKGVVGNFNVLEINNLHLDGTTLTRSLLSKKEIASTYYINFKQLD